MGYRSSLLVSYLEENPVWQEMIQVFEETYGNKVDQLAYKLSKTRDLYQLNTQGMQKTGQNLMYQLSDFDLPDRKTLIRICLMLGFTYPDVGGSLFSTESYLRIAQNIAAYYKEQGTASFLNFFAYCLNYQFDLKLMWTSDYVTFFPEGSLSIGTPIWAGGSWYPTSHVQFTVTEGVLSIADPGIFRNFFYYIAPINLVLLGTNYLFLPTSPLSIMMDARMQISL